jgi:hypothetical protein
MSQTALTNRFETSAPSFCVKTVLSFVAYGAIETNEERGSGDAGSLQTSLDDPCRVARFTGLSGCKANQQTTDDVRSGSCVTRGA